MTVGFGLDFEYTSLGETKTVPELSLPKRYKVVLLNDDFTPMDFVVEVLRKFFYLSDALATQIMLSVHQSGRGVCGVFTRDIAETKAALVNDYAKVNQHPLLCVLEQA